MNEEEVLKRWREFTWAEGVYTQWQGFFGSLIGQAARAEALCRLGMQLVRAEISGEPSIRTMFDKMIVESRAPDH